jgi:hypothetical protein
MSVYDQEFPRTHPYRMPAHTIIGLAEPTRPTRRLASVAGADGRTREAQIVPRFVL